MRRQSDAANSLRIAGRAARRFWLRGLLVFSVILAVAVLSIAYSKRVYVSEALLYMQLGRESVSLDPTATTGQVVSLNESREAEILSTVELLTSRSVLEGVVDELGEDFILENPADKEERKEEAGAAEPSSLDEWKGAAYQWLTSVGLADPAGQREKAVAKLRKWVTAEVREKTLVVEASSQGRSPQQAQKILQTVMEHYYQQHQKAHRTEGSYDFFAQQSEQLHTELEQANGALRDAKNRFGFASVESRRNMLHDELRQVELDAASTDAELAAAAAKLENLNKATAALPAEYVVERREGLPNEAVDNMRQQLYDVEIRERELLATHTPDHPKVRAMQEQLKGVSKILDSETGARQTWTLGVHPTRQPLELAALQESSQAAALKSRLEALQKQREKLQEKVALLNQQEIEIAELERTTQMLEANYRSYAERMEQARVDRVLQEERISSVNIVQSPTLIEKPVSPNKVLSLAIGMFAAMLGSFGVVYLSAIFGGDPDPALARNPVLQTRGESETLSEQQEQEEDEDEVSEEKQRIRMLLTLNRPDASDLAGG